MRIDCQYASTHFEIQLNSYSPTVDEVPTHETSFLIFSSVFNLVN